MAVKLNTKKLSPNFIPKFPVDRANIATKNGNGLGLKSQYQGQYTDAQLLSKGVTHLQSNNGTTNYATQFRLVKPGNSWWNNNSTLLQAYNAGKELAINSGWSKEMILTGEIYEDLQGNNVTHPNPRGMANEFVKGYWEEIQTYYGPANVGVEDTNIFGDYSGEGGDLGQVRDVFENPAKAQTYINAIASTNAARTKYHAGDRDFSAGIVSYLNEGRNLTSNVLLQIYYRNFDNKYGCFVPNMLYKIHRMYIAFPNRKQSFFTWTRIQELASQQAFQRPEELNIKYPTGTLHIRNKPFGTLPTYIGYQIGFLGALLIDRINIWSSESNIRDVNPQGNDQTLFRFDDGSPGINASDKSWTPNAGVRVPYDINNVSHPQPQNSTDHFANYPLGAVDGVSNGQDDVGELTPYLSTTLKWAKFSFNNGAYYTPNNGTFGTDVSLFGKGNAGQNTPVDFVNAKTAMVMIGTGPSGKCYIAMPCFTSPLVFVNIKVDDGGTIVNLGSIRGGEIARFILSNGSTPPIVPPIVPPVTPSVQTLNGSLILI